MYRDCSKERKWRPFYRRDTKHNPSLKFRVASSVPAKACCKACLWHLEHQKQKQGRLCHPTNATSGRLATGRDEVPEDSDLLGSGRVDLRRGWDVSGQVRV